MIARPFQKKMFGRARGRGNGGFVPAAGSGSAYDIVSITDGSAGAILVTTAAPHGLIGGEDIVISGTTTYDGPCNVNGGVPSTTTFKTTDFVYSSPTTGGTWAVV